VAPVSNHSGSQYTARKEHTEGEKNLRERGTKNKETTIRGMAFFRQKKIYGEVVFETRENKNRKRRRKKTRGVTKENRGKATANCRLPPRIHHCEPLRTATPP
jgi:hypothetical protein